MGYRSDVGFIIHFASEEEPEKAFADYRKFKQFVTTELRVQPEDASTPKPVLRDFYYRDLLPTADEADNFFGWNDEEMLFLLNNSNVKWYDSYPDVRFFEAVLAHAHSFATAGYRFVRFGEDITDTIVNDHTSHDYDSENPYWDMLQVERTYDFSPDREQLTREAS